MRFVCLLLLAGLSTRCATDPLRLDRHPAAAGGGYHAVIEIPAGTLAKMEVDKTTGALVQDVVNGRPRFVRYLPYPANYGMVPSSVLPRAEGGDGDPIDVIILGPALEAGSVVQVRPIGVLELRDRGEVDDKVLVVPLDARANSPFTGLADLAELDATFPNARTILELWFTSYKGAGIVVAKKWGDAVRARALIDRAIRSYAAGSP